MARLYPGRSQPGRGHEGETGPHAQDRQSAPRPGQAVRIDQQQRDGRPHGHDDAVVPRQPGQTGHAAARQPVSRPRRGGQQNGRRGHDQHDEQRVGRRLVRVDEEHLGRGGRHQDHRGGARPGQAPRQAVHQQQRAGGRQEAQHDRRAVPAHSQRRQRRVDGHQDQCGERPLERVVGDGGVAGGQGLGGGRQFGEEVRFDPLVAQRRGAQRDSQARARHQQDEQNRPPGRDVVPSAHETAFPLRWTAARGPRGADRRGCGDHSANRR